MKDKASGDYAPSRAPYQDFGRFRVTVSGALVWIRDMESNEVGQPFSVKGLELVVAKFYARNF